jgi:hypothetical protein
VTLCGDTIGRPCFLHLEVNLQDVIHPEVEGNKFLRNIDNLPQLYRASQTRRPRRESSKKGTTQMTAIIPQLRRRVHSQSSLCGFFRMLLFYFISHHSKPAPYLCISHPQQNKLSLYLTKCHAMKTYWESGGISPRIPKLCTRWK